MHATRFLYFRHIPLEFILHNICEGHSVDRRPYVSPVDNSDDTWVVSGGHLHLRDLVSYGIFYILTSTEYDFGVLDVATCPNFHHSSPGTCNDASWSGSGNSSSGIKTSIPCHRWEKLVTSNLLISEYNYRATLWSEAVLVWVAGDRSYSRHSEINKMR